MINPLVSIIIPVYNSEKYLCQCLDSVISQVYRNWECILVDDGSLDRSGSICDEYVAKDNRFRVFHKDNGGVSSARNIGIAESKGEWLFFADSDDVIEEDGIQTLVISGREDTDLVMAGFTIIDETGAVLERCLHQISKTITRHDALLEMYQPKDYSYQGYLWSKLIRADIVKTNNLLFNTDIYFNEDRLFITQLICFSSKSISYTTKSVYKYVLRSTGAMGSLSEGYNEKFATDLDAFVLMKQAVCSFCNDKDILNAADIGICTSYIKNHSYMIQFNAYNHSLHKSMLCQLRKSGAMKQYVKTYIFKPLLLLVTPKLLVNYKN